MSDTRPASTTSHAPTSREQWVRRVLTVLLATYWGLLALGTHLPIEVSEEVSKYDKLVHLGAYAGLGGLLTLWAWSARKDWSLAKILIGLAVYGALDEILQIPVGRTCDVRDWVADMIGLTIGAVVAKLLITRYGEKVISGAA